MHPQLEAIATELDEATRRAEAIVSQSSEDRLTKRPPDGGWSAAECIEHLNLTSQAILPRLDQALAGRPAVRLPARLRRDLIGWLIWKGVQPSGKMKAKTSPSFIPGSGRSVGEILAEFRELQTSLLERLRTADGVAVDRIKIGSPFNERVRYSAYSAFSVLAAHEHRHLAQAEQAVAAVAATAS